MGFRRIYIGILWGVYMYICMWIDTIMENQMTTWKQAVVGLFVLKQIYSEVFLL